MQERGKGKTRVKATSAPSLRMPAIGSAREACGTSIARRCCSRLRPRRSESTVTRRPSQHPSFLRAPLGGLARQNAQSGTPATECNRSSGGARLRPNKCRPGSWHLHGSGHLQLHRNSWNDPWFVEKPFSSKAPLQQRPCNARRIPSWEYRSCETLSSARVP